MLEAAVILGLLSLQDDSAMPLEKLRSLNASAAGWSVRETRCRWRWTNDMVATLTKFRYRAAAIRRASSSPPLIMKRFRTFLHTHFLGKIQLTFFKFCFVRVARNSRGRRTLGVYVPCIVFEHRASLFGAPFRTLCTHPYVQATRPSSLML